MLALLAAGCATPGTQGALYDDLGGQAGIEKLVGRFIFEIGNDALIRPYFEETDLDRFHEKLTEQICEVSGGPCRYSGDSMVDSHRNMGVTEAHFNQTVDLLIRAMEAEDIPHRVQNRLLAVLAPLREDIIYQ